MNVICPLIAHLIRGGVMKTNIMECNGIRACVQKGFLDFFKEADADIFCIQETKMQEGQLALELEVILPVLELRSEERDIRDCGFHEERAAVRSIRNRNRGA